MTAGGLFDPAPRVLPYGWRMLRKSEDGASYRSGDGLVVIISGAVELDGRRWIHLSVSRRDSLPDWSDLREVKNLFLGREALAVQVLPPESRYINIHPFVLHLWRCLDGEPVPDFARGGTSI